MFRLPPHGQCRKPARDLTGLQLDVSLMCWNMSHGRGGVTFQKSCPSTRSARWLAWVFHECPSPESAVHPDVGTPGFLLSHPNRPQSLVTQPLYILCLRGESAIREVELRHRCAHANASSPSVREAGTPGSSNRATADGSDGSRITPRASAYAHASALTGLAPGRHLRRSNALVGGPFATARAMRTVPDARIIPLQSTRSGWVTSSRAVGGQFW